jgi:hypothetical protein
MAYREPENLTCPTCGTSGEIVWVVGEGPNTEPGQAPDYVDVLDAGIWNVKTTATAPVWQGQITCPTCNETVKQHPPDP